MSVGLFSRGEDSSDHGGRCKGSEALPGGAYEISVGKVSDNVFKKTFWEKNKYSH